MDDAIRALSVELQLDGSGFGTVGRGERGHWRRVFGDGGTRVGRSRERAPRAEDTPQRARGADRQAALSKNWKASAVDELRG